MKKFTSVENAALALSSLYDESTEFENNSGYRCQLEEALYLLEAGQEIHTVKGEWQYYAISETRELESLVSEIVLPDCLYQFYTAPHGYKLGLYANSEFSEGSFAVGTSVGHEISEEDMPFAIVPCPGIENIDDPSFWVEGWTEQTEDGNYRIIDNCPEGYEIGQVIDLDEAIHICCENGDVEQEIESLRKRLIKGD